MITVTSVIELQKLINTYKSDGKRIGFVPTMGALHQGHMSLMNASNTECDITVCSVFVNPTQFNQENDLAKYPRTLKADEMLLDKNGVDIVFAPPENEVYPNNLNTNIEIEFDGLDKEMEGEFRPGHFAGVVQVVKRLLDIVLPEALYMGQKDFQQFTIINFMINKLNVDTQLRIVPIVREKSGLAMSSRNVRLSETNKKAAEVIYKTLKAVKRNKYKMSCAALEKYAMNRLSKIPNFRPEYFTIANARTLRSINNVKSCDYVVACTAVWAGDVRLIDNTILRKPRKLKIFVKTK
ncbi:MAG: pantoate--beta-alanine ligase [Saprospiraceae bacterium]